ncbi:hypothetical protein HAX54_051338 [Datura stramonium]|uniref:Uncharacterized protein n=1 Tax=Datura stramonium TaxID=4076 RepID=A0ABS8WPL3_DATST|nr:hypothetical protein [Datura stramonium]
MERTYGCTVWFILNTNIPSYVPVGSTVAIASPPQSKEGGEEAESDGEHPPTDNAEEGNDDAEEIGDEDTEVEESGDKESAAEKSSKQVGDFDLATTPKARSMR